MEAIEALCAAEIVVGYKTYTHLVKAFTGDKQDQDWHVRKYPNAAVRLLNWRRLGITLISGRGCGNLRHGAGAGTGRQAEAGCRGSPYSGMTASIAAASLLGAPLMHDFCHISLSDR